jgi:hypothetical protein
MVVQEGGRWVGGWWLLCASLFSPLGCRSSSCPRICMGIVRLLSTSRRDPHPSRRPCVLGEGTSGRTIAFNAVSFVVRWLCTDLHLLPQYPDTACFIVVLVRSLSVSFALSLHPSRCTVVSYWYRSTLHGDGSNCRTYLYAADVARAFDCVLHRGVVGQIYNIGGDNEVSNLDVAKSLLRYVNETNK